MRTLRAGICALVLVTAASLLVACSDDPESPTAPTSTATSSTPGPDPSAAPSTSTSTTTSAGPTPTGSASSTEGPKPESTSSDKPVPKVGRSGAPASPTVSAKPAQVDGTVRYGDGVALQVVSVDFAKETKKGPGGFPGREYAILTLEIANRSKTDLSLDSVVITVLDKANQPVPPVYVQEADVADFAGALKAGKTVRARYAFAVPVASRSKVTVVVDFDGVHTSAVFRGELD